MPRVYKRDDLNTPLLHTGLNLTKSYVHEPQNPRTKSEKPKADDEKTSVNEGDRK